MEVEGGTPDTYFFMSFFQENENDDSAMESDNVTKYYGSWEIELLVMELKFT